MFGRTSKSTSESARQFAVEKFAQELVGVKDSLELGIQNSSKADVSSLIEGQQATLRFSGEDTQIDKYVVERIMEPLLHLVRNAVSHGLEPSEARVAAGKSAVGHIDLRARTTGEIVVIEVEDDGGPRRHVVQGLQHPLPR